MSVEIISEEARKLQDRIEEALKLHRDYCDSSPIGTGSFGYRIPSTEKKYITVKRLREALLQYPDDMPVIYATDDEGNRHKMVNYLPSISQIEDTLEDLQKNFKNSHYDLTLADDDKKSKKIKCLMIN